MCKCTIFCLDNVPSFLDILFEFFVIFQFVFDVSYSLVLSYLPTPPLGQDTTQGQFLSGV